MMLRYCTMPSKAVWLPCNVDPVLRPCNKVLISIYNTIAIFVGLDQITMSVLQAQSSQVSSSLLSICLITSICRQKQELVAPLFLSRDLILQRPHLSLEGAMWSAVMLVG